MEKRLKGRSLVAGAASGRALVATTPLSLWGGLDPATGNIPDRRHELCGQCMTGRVFVFPTGKGSSTASAILAESIRNGTAPAAIIMARTDPIVALGAIVADEMYGKTVPVVVLPAGDYNAIADGDLVTVEPDGSVAVAKVGTGTCSAFGLRSSQSPFSTTDEKETS